MKDRTDIEEYVHNAELIFEEEKNRTAIEKYKVREIGKWAIIPCLLSVIFFVYVLFFEYELYLLILTIIPTVLIASIIDIQEKWEIRLSGKFRTESKFFYNLYKTGFLYTDSKKEYFIYKTAQILSYLVNFLLIILIIILFFIWLKETGVDMGAVATVIIIILLIIIIINQNRKKTHEEDR